MRRLTLLGLAALLALGIWGVALAAPGPQPNPHPFDLIVRELGRDGGEIYERFSFDGTVYDFGGRAAYACAFVEFIQDGEVEFLLTVELAQGYPQGIEIIDTDHSGEPVQAVCGDGLGPGVTFPPDGSPFAPVGVDIPVFKDGELLTTFTLPGVGQDNDETSYSPGDEPGEAWMWYDEGHTGNPVKVARVWITPVGEGVSLTGPSPTGPTTPTGPTAPPLECFSGELASEVDGHLEGFRVCIT